MQETLSGSYYENCFGKRKSITEASRANSAERRAFFDSVKNQFQDRLKIAGINGFQLLLTGSTAKNAADKGSDIDIIVVNNSGYSTPQLRQMLTDSLRDLYQDLDIMKSPYQIDFHFYDPSHIINPVSLYQLEQKSKEE